MSLSFPELPYLPHLLPIINKLISTMLAHKGKPHNITCSK
jgi:hypothetical protein